MWTKQHPVTEVQNKKSTCLQKKWPGSQRDYAFVYFCHFHTHHLLSLGFAVLWHMSSRRKEDKQPGGKEQSFSWRMQSPVSVS